MTSSAARPSHGIAERPAPPHLWLPPGGRFVLVDNACDDVAVSHHLNTLDGPGHSQVVVRPTPGTASVHSLGLDLLVALGKNPYAARTERLAASTWPAAAAWLRGQAVTDLIIDRAHRLTAGQLEVLAHTAVTADATLWLIWAAPHHEAIARLHALLDRPVDVIGLDDFRRLLPSPAHPRTREPDQQPALPAADFTTFLATCRRHLPGDDFAAVKQDFHATAAATDAWLARLDLASATPHRLNGAVTGWLRDDTVGRAATDRSALIRLRAVQAALFLAGIRLNWRPETLGPDPEWRLPGDLTALVSARLHAVGRTDTAAATALALHLNHASTHFGFLLVGDIAADGSAVHTPGQPGPDTIHRISYPGTGTRRSLPHELHVRDSAWHEFAGPEPLCIPPHARALFIAHLAHRRRQDAADRDPYFVHLHAAHRDPQMLLLGAIRRTCQQIGLDPPWLHGEDCPHGSDVGQSARAHPAGSPNAACRSRASAPTRSWSSPAPPHRAGRRAAAHIVKERDERDALP
ncbi:hypothetical protein FHU36_003774 [Nonomuraea muscovyensis]|uniref:Uncharacterized protein n=1 Tax=Nonomuraea muscovyensis TaxID=1124761 RepID=A0A7X0C298_9ACTN|nr:hypothetical protein [Nonomuraea muscovyensis]MBB6347229.1 hypothetical protein [Nonomuraea muscovyensis]